MLRGWIARQFGLDRNPLRRRSDRVEAWATVILVSTVLLAGPALAYATATAVYRDSVRTIEHERRTLPGRGGPP